MVSDYIFIFLFIFAFFFFKQKTAYEMRISDWSSDVCSSDLALGIGRSIIDARYPGVRDRARAHCAGLQRHPEIAALEPFLPQRLRRAADNEHLGEIGRASCRERVCQYV